MKKQLNEKLTELKGLQEKINDGDVEAIKAGETLMNEIKELKEKIKAAEEAEKLLKGLGGNEPEKKDEGIKGLNMSHLKDEKGSVSTFLKNLRKDAPTPAVITGSQVVSTSESAPVPNQGIRVRDLFGHETISGNAITYYVQKALVGEIGTVAEGAKKPQIELGYEPKTVALAKVAAFFKETDELVLDNAFLESAIRNRGIYEFNKAIDKYLITTLLATTGIQTASGITFDSILKAKQKISATTGYEADALVLNPADLETLLTTKDSNNQYLLGGPAYGAYGSGEYNSNPRIWGLEVVESSGITQGTAVVGAFQGGATVVEKNGEGVRVEVANTDVDDFEYNRVTVRIEERLVEAVRVPAAFCKLTASV